MNWSNGVLEPWNNGLLEEKSSPDFFEAHHFSIPRF